MPLIEATQAQELMVTTMIYDHAARKHSYELLAEMFTDRLPTSDRCDVMLKDRTARTDVFIPSKH